MHMVVSMNKFWSASILILLLGSHSASASDVCGRLTRASKKAQLIPPQGKIKPKTVENDPVDCGAMVITGEESVWVELSDQSSFKIAPFSFFELAQKGQYRFQLYRGSVMASAPMGIHGFDLFTPNSISVFQGGIMTVSYDPKEKESVLSSFSRKVEFKNKFHQDASQVVSAGELSRLWIGESRLVPSEPEIMDPRTVKPAFKAYALPGDEVNELVAIVERAVESRSKSFVADIESWEDIEEENERIIERNLASVSNKENKVESSIDQKEAARALSLLKNHLFGEESDWKIHDESRKPSSTNAHDAFKDSEYDRKKAVEKKQVQKTVEAIKNLE